MKGKLGISITLVAILALAFSSIVGAQGTTGTSQTAALTGGSGSLNTGTSQVTFRVSN